MTLGDPIVRVGNQGGVTVTDVPIDLLKHLKLRPVPVTISGTNNVIFTLAASTTRPVWLWNGDDFVALRRNLTYTWAASGNSTLSSSGVVTSSGSSSSAAVGVHYMYLDKDGQTLYSSQTAPSFAEGPSETGLLGHPGTSRTQNYIYVGFMSSTATTPAFEAMTKLGYTYHLAATNVATATTWAELDFSAFIPTHLSAFGGTVSGYLETGAAGTVRIGTTSTNTIGKQEAKISTTAETMHAPFEIVPTAAGKIYAQHVTAAGDVWLSAITDVV